MPLDLVIAADQPDTGVMADATRILLDLGKHAVKQLLVGIIHRASKHKITKNHKPQLVAYIKEPIVGIKAAAPQANGVEVAVLTMLQERTRALGRDATQNIILGHVICAHGEHIHAVDAVIKANTISIRLSDKLHISQANA